MKEGWKKTRLGEIITLQYGKPLDRKLREASGKYAVYGANGIKDRSDEYYFDKRSIIVGRKGSAGEVNLSEEKFWPLDVTYFVEFDENRNDLYFLYYLLLSLDLPQLAKGVKPGINRNEVYDIHVTIPPLDEQQRIVQKLDAAFAAIDQAIANTEKNLEQPENLFQVMLDQSFDEMSGAEKNILDSICELIVDCEHKTAPTELSGYPSIRTTNIGKGKINFNNVNYVSYDSYIQWTRRAVPQPDDLILAREAPAGNVAIIPEGYKVCLGQRTVLLRPKKDVITSKYLMYNLLSSKIRKKLLAHSKGATVAHVNVKDIRNLDIGPIPEFDQQQNIISKIEEVVRITTLLVENYQAKIENLQELKQSILQKAFQGDL